MPFDFDTIKDTDTVVKFHPRDPNTDMPILDVSFDLVGCTSSVYKSAKRAAANRILANAQKGAKKITTAEAIEDQTIDRLARCIKGWSGVIVGGKVVEFSFENAVKLLTEVSVLREQIEEFVEEKNNFLTK